MNRCLRIQGSCCVLTRLVGTKTMLSAVSFLVAAFKPEWFRVLEATISDQKPSKSALHVCASTKEQR